MEIITFLELKEQDMAEFWRTNRTRDLVNSVDITNYLYECNINIQGTNKFVTPLKKKLVKQNFGSEILGFRTLSIVRISALGNS
jgi:hypothetical protein